MRQRPAGGYGRSRPEFPAGTVWPGDSEPGEPKPRARAAESFRGGSGGAEIYRKEQRSAALQIQVSNLADRVNVINFASLFSGTAVEPPPSVSAKLKLTF